MYPNRDYTTPLFWLTLVVVVISDQWKIITNTHTHTHTHTHIYIYILTQDYNI